jgi:amino acid transporter
VNGAALLQLLAETARSVVVAVVPLVLVFLAFQALLVKLPPREVARILRGTLVAALGLFLFIAGVSLAFLPFGALIGKAVAGLPHPAWMLAIGLVLGFVTTWGEPAVRILADEVEDASGGSIRRGLVLTTICAGVAVSVGLGMLRITLDIPVAHLLLPGYALALVLMHFSDKAFVAIGADAGGVATGPLANSFLLALALGLAAGDEQADPLLDGLGLVALIALAPILSVMLLGLVIRSRTRPAPSSPGDHP